MSSHYSTDGSAPPSWVSLSSVSRSTDPVEAFLREHIPRLPLADRIEPRKLLRSLELARIERNARLQYEPDGSCSTEKLSRADSGYGSESTGSSTTTSREEHANNRRDDVADQIKALQVLYPDFYEENWRGIWKIESASGCANDEPINHIREQCLLELRARLKAKQNPDQIDLSLVEGGRAHKAIREAARFPDAFLERSLSSIREGCEMPDGLNSERVESNVTGDIYTSLGRDSADLMSPKTSLSMPISDIPSSPDTEPALIGASSASTATLSDDGSQFKEPPPPSDIPGRPDNQHEGTKAKRKLEIELLDLGSTRKISELRIINAIDIARDSRLSDDQTTSPVSELGIVVDPEVRNGEDPATDPTCDYNSAPPGATTPTCETPISQPPPLSGIDFGFTSLSPATASPGSKSLSDSNFDFDLGSTTARTSEALQSPVLAQSPSTAKVEEAPSNREALEENSAVKHRKGIRSRLRARLKKPDRWNLEPGPRQTMSRENLQCWWARRAARRKERRARPPELEESDFSSMSFTSSSMSGATESEGSGKEFSVGSRHESDNGSESTRDSSSEASGRRDGFYNLKRPRLIDLLPVEKVQPRQPRGRGRFPKFSRSRPRRRHQGLFARFQRRKKPLRIVD
jgi:hypothetical protein